MTAKHEPNKELGGMQLNQLDIMNIKLYFNCARGYPHELHNFLVLRFHLKFQSSMLPLEGCSLSRPDFLKFIDTYYNKS